MEPCFRALRKKKYFRWDIVDIAGRACQVRMSTRTVWSVRFHMFMSLVNSLATKGAEKYANNMIKGEKVFIFMQHELCHASH